MNRQLLAALRHGKPLFMKDPEEGERGGGGGTADELEAGSGPDFEAEFEAAFDAPDDEPAPQPAAGDEEEEEEPTPTPAAPQPGQPEGDEPQPAQPGQATGPTTLEEAQALIQQLTQRVAALEQPAGEAPQPGAPGGATPSPGTGTPGQPRGEERPTDIFADVELSEDERAFMEDYPDAASVLRKVAGKLEGIYGGQVQELDARIRREAFRGRITSGYLDPESKKWVPGHQDADHIIESDGFWTYFEAERTKNPNLIRPTHNVQDTIAVIGRYKEQIARAAAQQHDSRRRGQAGEAAEALSSGFQPTPGSAAGGSHGSQDDFDAGWDLPSQEG